MATIISLIRAIVVNVKPRYIIIDGVSAIERNMAFDSVSTRAVPLNSTIEKEMLFDATVTMVGSFKSRIRKILGLKSRL
jgi:hypothetical protein